MCTYQRIAAALFCCCIVTGLALCLTPYRIWHLRQVHSAEQPQALRAGREQAASSLIYETRPDAVVMEDDPILVRGTATPSGKVQQSGHLSAVPPAHRAWSPHGLVVPPCSTWSWHSRMAALRGLTHAWRAGAHTAYQVFLYRQRALVRFKLFGEPGKKKLAAVIQLLRLPLGARRAPPAAGRLLRPAANRCKARLRRSTKWSTT